MQVILINLMLVENKSFTEVDTDRMEIGTGKDFDVRVDKKECGNVLQGTNEKGDMTSNGLEINEPDLEQGKTNVLKTSTDNSCIEETSLVVGLDQATSVTGKLSH